MNETVLGFISKLLSSLGINYQFMQWNGEPQYPYFVGVYSEAPELDESGEMRIDFILSGFTRGSWLELEEAKTKIAEGTRDVRAVIDGIGIAVFYSSSIPVPEETDELKRIQITLDVRVWRTK